MIKVNLVTRKQLSSSKGGGGNTDIQSLLSGALAGFKSDARLDGLKDLPIRKFALAILTCYAASYMLDSYKDDEMTKVDVLITRARDDQTKVKAQLAKTKGFDEIKAALDADEQTLRVKIETITKLLDALKDPPKMMKSLSAAIPQDVWLKSLKVTDKEVEFKGQSFGFALISDFMRALSESAYFTDLKLVNTQKDNDGGPDVVAFELEAKKR